MTQPLIGATEPQLRLWLLANAAHRMQAPTACAGRSRRTCYGLIDLELE